MGQRNMLCPSQMIDLEIDQRDQGYLHNEPCIFLGDRPNYPPPDIQMGVTVPGNTSLDTHPLPEHYDSGMFYGVPQYPGVQHHNHSPNLDLGIGSASNYYIPYVANPSSSAHVSHGPTDQMPSSSNYNILGVSANEYARNCHFMDNVRGSYKRKNSEGILGNFQHFNASSSSSSSATPLNARNPDGAGTMDAAPFTISQYRGNGPPPVREAGSQRSVRNRLGATAVDPVLMHSANHVFQGNYIGQPFQPTITEGGSSAWTQAPGVPYMHGGNVGAPMETSLRSSTSYSHPSPLDFRNHNFHHPAPPIEGIRGHSINIHPQVAAVPHRFPASYASQSTMNPSHDGWEMGRRHLGPVPPTGFRIYQSRRESGIVPETTGRHHNRPHLRVLPPDGIAVLELPEFYEVGNFIDHHREMRLDIEDMSYEELLALGERIGKVNTGLSEETIKNKLKTRTYSTFATNINLEEAAPVDQESDSCIICQEDYKNQEKIGILDCGHEYHADCLKKWLFVKNVCPICKSEALATESKNV